MAVSLLHAGGPALCRSSALWLWGMPGLFDFYAIATLFHVSDMMYEMRTGKLKPTLVQSQGIFNLPHYVGIYEMNWPLMIL